MATETRIHIKRNPYQGYEVWLWGNGELTRRSFDNSFDLSNKLAADCVSDRDIEAACDMFERLEWEEPEYPLGVSYRPPAAEAVCDSPIDEPVPAPRPNYIGSVNHRFYQWTVAFLTVTVAWLVFRRNG